MVTKPHYEEVSISYTHIENAVAQYLAQYFPSHNITGVDVNIKLDGSGNALVKVWTEQNKAKADMEEPAQALAEETPPPPPKEKVKNEKSSKKSSISSSVS